MRYKTRDPQECICEGDDDEDNEWCPYHGDPAKVEREARADDAFERSRDGDDMGWFE